VPRIPVATLAGTLMTDGTLLPDAQLWKHLYRAAVLETNMELVPRRILEARKAAGERAMHLIREAAVDEPELQDLVYAKQVLDELERKCQSARQSGPDQSTPER
jgi:hypothetical protein